MTNDKPSFLIPQKGAFVNIKSPHKSKYCKCKQCKVIRPYLGTYYCDGVELGCGNVFNITLSKYGNQK